MLHHTLKLKLVIMYSIKQYIIGISYTILVTILLWIAISSIIQAFKCPSMTQTQLFMHIPKSVICDWQDCNNQNF